MRMILDKRAITVNIEPSIDNPNAQTVHFLVKTAGIRVSNGCHSA